MRILLICASVVWIVVGAWLIKEEVVWRGASAKTPGLLTSAPVAHMTGARNTRSTEYNVEYDYKVGGRTYSGHDSIVTKPESGYVTVYYERANPSNSKAEQQNLWWTVMTIAIATAALVYFGWFY